MNTAQQAQQVLDALSIPDQYVFDSTLETVYSRCQTVRSISTLEREQQEVLEGVVQHLRRFRETNSNVPPSNDAALVLLRHLQDRSASQENPFAVFAKKSKVRAETCEMLYRVDRTPQG